MTTSTDDPSFPDGDAEERERQGHPLIFLDPAVIVGFKSRPAPLSSYNGSCLRSIQGESVWAPGDV
jgi:hypothetical protein